MMRKRRRDDEAGSPGGKDPARSFSKNEVQSLLQQEVTSAVKQSDSKMESLLERVQRLECEPNFDITIRKLEAHIKKVKRRGDAALAYVKMLGASGVKVTQNPNASGPVDRTEINSGTSTVNLVGCESDDEEIAEHKKTMDGFRQNMMANSKKSMLPVQKQEEERNGSIQRTPPPVLSSSPIPCHPEPPVLSQVPKAEPTAIPVTSPDVTSPARSSPGPEASLAPVKIENSIKREESSPPPISSPPSPPPCVSDLLSRHPHLPSTPFPSSLPLEAASYSIPQKLFVELSRLQHPPSLVISWKVLETDPASPVMDSYSIYMSQESPRGSGLFPSWRNVGVVKALALPMVVTVTKYQLGITFVTVVGRDCYGRFGPYSDVTEIVLSY